MIASDDPIPASSFDAYYDTNTGIIRTFGCGLWSIEDIDIYFAIFYAVIEEARRMSPSIYIMSDAREEAVQPMDVAQKIEEMTATAFHEGDYIAQLVSASAVAMLVKRPFHNATLRDFTSVIEAEAWLQECRSKN